MADKPNKIEWAVFLLMLAAAASIIAGVDLMLGHGAAFIALGGLLFVMAHLFAKALKKNG